MLTGHPGPGRPAYLDAWGGPLALEGARAVARELRDTRPRRVFCVVPEERFGEEMARATATGA